MSQATMTNGSFNGDHDIGRNDDRLDLCACLQPKFVDSFIVIEEVTVKPFTSIRTCEMAAPFLTSLTVPSRTLRAEILMFLASSSGFQHPNANSGQKVMRMLRIHA